MRFAWPYQRPLSTREFSKLLIVTLTVSLCVPMCLHVCTWSCQVSTLRQDLQVKEKQYEVRLQAIEDSHRHSALELREMLAAHQQMSAKYVFHSCSCFVF